MTWVEENINLGNIITIISVVLVGAFTVGVTYNKIEAVDTSLERHEERISSNEQNISKLIEQNTKEYREVTELLNNEFARSKDLESLKTDITGRLDRMSEDLKYLIRIQGGGYKNE